MHDWTMILHLHHDPNINAEIPRFFNPTNISTLTPTHFICCNNIPAIFPFKYLSECVLDGLEYFHTHSNLENRRRCTNPDCLFPTVVKHDHRMLYNNARISLFERNPFDPVGDINTVHQILLVHVECYSANFIHPEHHWVGGRIGNTLHVLQMSLQTGLQAIPHWIVHTMDLDVFSLVHFSEVPTGYWIRPDSSIYLYPCSATEERSIPPHYNPAYNWPAGSFPTTPWPSTSGRSEQQQDTNTEAEQH